jgi:hypothetical protein
MASWGAGNEASCHWLDGVNPPHPSVPPPIVSSSNKAVHLDIRARTGKGSKQTTWSNSLSLRAGGASGLPVTQLREGGQSLRIPAHKLRLIVGRPREPSTFAPAQHNLSLPLPGATPRNSVVVLREVPRGQRRSCVLRARSWVQR